MIFVFFKKKVVELVHNCFGRGSHLVCSVEQDDATGAAAPLRFVKNRDICKYIFLNICEN